MEEESKRNEERVKIPWWLRRTSLFKDEFFKNLIQLYYANRDKWKEQEQEFSDIVSRILLLYLEEETVGDVLISWGEVKYLSTETTLEEVEELVKKTKHSRYPVLDIEKGEVVGLLHVKDLITKSDQIREKGWLSILRPAHFIPEDIGIFNALKKMQDQKSHMLIVINSATEGLEGIITMEDILEQIIGDITDEFDQERERKKYIMRVEGSSIIVRGDTPIRVLREKLGIEVDEELEEKVDSVAGLIIAENGFIIPDVGTTVKYNGWEFQVVKSDASKIEQVRLRPIPGKES